MRAAYTVVEGLGTPHLNVGRTFPNREQAEAAVGSGSITKVVAHIDDFSETDYGYFTIRTDMSHEVSFVVVEEETLDEWGTESGDTAFVGTRIASPEGVGDE